MLQKIITVIKDHPGFDLDQSDLDKITPESNLFHDIGMDSIDLVEICLELEREFKIVIYDNELETWRTVKDIINTLNKIIK